MVYLFESRDMGLPVSLYPCLFSYIGCTKEGSRKNYATYEIKEYDFAIFELQCKMFIAKHIAL